MKMKKLLALILTATLCASVMVFSPAAPSVMAAEELTLSPTKDGYAAMTDTLGTDMTVLEIGYNSAAPLDVDTGCVGGSNRGELRYARDALLSFDGADIQAEAVTSAVLKLTIAEAKNFGAQDNQCVSINVAAFETENTWSGNIIKWDAAPAAGKFAGISHAVTANNCAVGTAVTIDLTDYIRSHPGKADYSFRLKASGAGLNFYSSEHSNPSYRPVLNVTHNAGLVGNSKSYAGGLEADTYTENSNDDKNANHDKPLEGNALMTVSADKATGGDTNGALYRRDGYIKVKLPKAGAWYDRAMITLRADSTDNTNVPINVIPVSSSLDLGRLTFDNAPAINGDAAFKFTVPNNNSSKLNYFTLDIADYVNSHPNEDGVYVFALTADTAIAKFHTSEAELDASRPKTSFIYRDRAKVTVHYVKPNMEDLQHAVTLDAPVGEAYSPDIPGSIEGWHFSSAATEDKNTLPYTIKDGENDIYLVYDDTSISGYEEISVTTVQYEQPELPDELEVYFDGGTSQKYPVSWASIDADALAVPGTITAVGTLQGIEAEAVKATVTVHKIVSIALPTVTTVVGSYPSLPETLTATVDGGDEDDESDDYPHVLSVVWNEIPSESYQNKGSFAVGGTVVSSGSAVQVTVLVEDEVTTTDLDILADAYTSSVATTTPHNDKELRVSGISASNPGASANEVRRTFLRFEGGEFKPAPEDGNGLDPIVTAKVRLYFQSIGNNAKVTYKIYAISPKDDKWEESTLTWLSAESIVDKGEYISSLTIQSSNGNKNEWVELDVTPYIRAHRDQSEFAFFVESDLCAAIITSKEGDAAQRPVLRTYGYIENTDVSLQYVADINGRETEIAEATELIGKLGNPYDYRGAPLPNPIYYPDADPDGIYYYDFVTVPEAGAATADADEPAEEALDPALHLDKLEESGNVIKAHYTRREITKVEPVKVFDAETEQEVNTSTWQGVKPRLPEAVTVVLDNGTKLTRSVNWNWDEVDFTEHSAIGTYTVKGEVYAETGYKDGASIPSVITPIPATAEIDVYRAYYGDTIYQSANSFDLQSGKSYRLSFEVADNKDLPDYMGDFIIHDGENVTAAYDMDRESFIKWLSSFAPDDRAELFFTAPDGAATLTLTVPDTVKYTVNYELHEILGRGGSINVHYMDGADEIYSQYANIAYGEKFSLPEEFFTVMDGAYIVNGIDAGKSDLDSLTGSIEEARDGMNIYLKCAPSPAFAMNAEVENVIDGDGKAYTRSTVTAHNGTKDERGAAIIVARFGPDGRLVSVEHQDMSVTSADGSVSRVISAPVEDDGYTALLVWNDLTGAQPVLPKIDSRNPTGMSAKPATGDGILIPALGRSVTATEEQEGNEAPNMLNRDLSSRWSAQAKAKGDTFDPITATPVSAVVDLGGLYDLHTVGLAFYQGKSRRARFSVDVSADGEGWDTVVQPRFSSGRTNGIEYFTFDITTARYVRVNGYGWTASEITDNGLVDTNGDWFSVTAFEAYGEESPVGGQPSSEFEGFEGLNGTKLAKEPTSRIDWGADALNEMTYTDYTPATGGSLYANIAKTPDVEGFEPGNTALHLYDNVDRDGKDGAGSIGAYHKLAVPSTRYTISFKWYVPTTVDGKAYNAQWAGVTLSSGRIKGGADTGDPAAFQLRLAPSGTSKMAFNIMRTITYNEGDQSGLLGTGTAFKAGVVWDVVMDVDSRENSVAITVSDGIRTESAYTRYNLYNAERTMSQTWNNSAVDYIMFNTGAGGKCEMYIDDFAVTPVVEDPADEGELIFSEDYSGVADGTEIKNNKVANTTSALIKESGQSYTPAYGSMLGVSVATQSMTDGRALYLKDHVAREGDKSKGLGGVFAYVDIGDLPAGTVSTVSFDMFVPTAGEYAGFALGSGHNEGGDDQQHPLALQARFSPQSDGIQINNYPSVQYNKSTWKAFVGTGNKRLDNKKVWHFDISVNPVMSTITVTVTDGSKVSTGTASIPTSGEDDWSVDWKSTPINTLIFNTGAGTSTDMYIDNIEVHDTGIVKNSYPAVNGLVRYENEYGTGSGNKEGSFLVHSGQEGSRLGIARNQNPYYTRFIERRGLADPDSVSLQIIGQPNCYLVPVTDGDGSIVTVQRYQDNETFRKKATFNKVTNLAGAGNTAYSYQWYYKPELYLRNNGNYLHISKSGDTGINKACTFHVRNEANNYVSDSFNGSSLSGQWHKGYPWYANYHNHSAVHRDENVVVSGGRVLLKATKVGSNEWIKNSSGQTGYSDSINGGAWKKYCAWTGVISVPNKKYNKGSYIEGSFKQPNSPRGYWTAFWLDGSQSWPPETDMFEYLSSHGTSTWYTATHGGSEGAGWMSSSSVGNMRTQWNTFAIDWGYNYIKMYVNGQLYFDRDNTSDVSAQKDMWLILNTGIGAWESEPDSSTVWGQGLECQWLRSYQYY